MGIGMGPILTIVGLNYYSVFFCNWSFTSS